MSQKLHLWIKSVIDSTPGLTQKGLAEAMGVNPAAVNRMLYGARNIKFDELPIIEEYLGQKFEAENKPPPIPPYQEIYAGGAQGNIVYNGRINNDNDVVPVYGYASGENRGVLNLDDDEAADWVMRHPMQRSIRDAFAVYVFSDDMEPRYFLGELVYIHPGRPPEQNKDCLIKRKDGTAVLRRFIRRDDKRVFLRQLKPAKDVTMNFKDIATIYSVVGRG